MLLAGLGLQSIEDASAAPQCGTFEQVQSPGMMSLLTSTGGNVWSLGASSSNSGARVLRRFDGVSWDEFSLPSAVDGFDFGASGSTPDGDVWFAGSRAYTVYEVEVVLMRVRNGVVDRIDTLPVSSAAIDISGASGDNVLALTSKGDVLRFDGSGWQFEDVPPMWGFDQRIYPKAIYAASANNVWTVGYGSPRRGAYYGYIQHWNGSQWNKISTAFDVQNQTFFRDVDGSGPGDVWIAGNSGNSASIMLHWDGASLSQIADSSAPYLPMGRVMAMAPGNAWAIPRIGNINALLTTRRKYHCGSILIESEISRILES